MVSQTTLTIISSFAGSIVVLIKIIFDRRKKKPEVTKSYVARAIQEVRCTPPHTPPLHVEYRVVDARALDDRLQHLLDARGVAVEHKVVESAHLQNNMSHEKHGKIDDENLYTGHTVFTVVPCHIDLGHRC